MILAERSLADYRRLADAAQGSPHRVLDVRTWVIHRFVR